MAKVFVLRALPGAGKTSMIEELKIMHGADNVHVCSSDLYPGLYGEDGSFHPELLPKSHAASLKKFVELCQEAFDETVIVSDNTNLSVAEFAPYVQVATAYGHDVEIITIECSPTVAAARNTHGVPPERYMSLKARMDEGTKGIMPWWKHTVVQAWMPQAA